jgi:hypothetical protein
VLYKEVFEGEKLVFYILGLLRTAVTIYRRPRRDQAYRMNL